MLIHDVMKQLVEKGFLYFQIGFALAKFCTEDFNRHIRNDASHNVLESRISYQSSKI